MTARPIIFTGESVRAILAASKTQTRRPVHERLYVETDDRIYNQSDEAFGDALLRWGRCPYGKPGDVLWVRETFAIERSIEGLEQTRPFNDGRPASVVSVDGDSWWEQPHYAATDPKPELVGENDRLLGWRSPIFMPRWASRLTLRVTDVRVQRLQEITEEDARAEGVEPHIDHPIGDVPPSGHARAFERAWDAINGRRAPWASSPWVWAITFERVACTGEGG